MHQTSNPTVIVGGGFVGLFTALHLSRQNYQRPVILIEPHDRFSFKPLLYELLSGELHVQQVHPRYIDLLSNSHVTLVQDKVQSINLPQRQVVLASGKHYEYGNLVLALGSKTAYLNTPGAVEYTMPLTSGTEAIALRDHLKYCLHSAAQTLDAERRRLLLTVAIIGAGPAGIELACTLGDLLPLWYEDLGGDGDEVRVVLFNRSRELLKGDINSRLRCRVQRSLRQRAVPVELVFDATVKAIQPDAVEYEQHEVLHSLKAGTIAWTAGTAPHPLLMNLPVAPEHRDRRGRLLVTPTLQLPDFPDVFAAGDCATPDANPQPPTAQVAYQQGKAIAHNLQAIATNNPPLPVIIHLRGTLMKLGLNEGVANLFNKVEIKGQPGHLIREATYLELLPSPIHNAKITADWLTDELFQRHRPFSYQRLGQTPWLSGIATIAAGLVLATPLAWRAAQPTQFHQTLSWTGVPTLLDRITPPSK
ncbi:NADH dehydrogenase, FAD-containing subunit [Leptolyngbyaceae cyanobacterium JSC-12]|nr:NADH dehydrogenase, FAD-containing subunit [Leptolyngbyaceae cyanobacterium JSC-12]